MAVVMRRLTRRRRRQLLVATIVVSVACVVLGGIAATPVLMRLTAGGDASWDELSDIGQAYGGVSAVLSGLAFCAIAGSLLLQ
jgi:hypothetical protein